MVRVKTHAGSNPAAQRKKRNMFHDSCYLHFSQDKVFDQSKCQ